jgi:hypothetical protein
MLLTFVSAGIFSAFIFALCHLAEGRLRGDLRRTVGRLLQRDPALVANLREDGQTKHKMRAALAAFGRSVGVTAIFFVLALLSAPESWQRVAGGYDGDSFHRLDLPALLGLALLSIVLAIALFTLALTKTLGLWRFATRWSLSAVAWRASADLVTSLLLFYVFVWFSPQLYYFYYLADFDGLPWQWVVKPPLDPRTVWDLLQLDPDGSLSEHLQGLLGRALALLALGAPALALATRLCHFRSADRRSQPMTLAGIAPYLASLGFLMLMVLNI